MPETNPEPDPARIDLEAKLTFLERTVEVMGKVMHEQTAEIEALLRRIERIEHAAAEADDDRAGHGMRPHDDPPPHY